MNRNIYIEICDLDQPKKSQIITSIAWSFKTVENLIDVISWVAKFFLKI